MQGYPFAFHQPLGACNVIGGSGMVKCLDLQAIVFIPLTGANVILGYVARRQVLSEALAQQICKEMVIAVPTPLVVQGDDEQVGAVEIFQDCLPEGKADA